MYSTMQAPGDTKVIAYPMLQVRQHRSEIERLASSYQFSMRKKWIKLVDSNSNLNFLHLSLDFLHQYIRGTYRIKQSKGYAKDHLYANHQEFALEFSPSDNNLFRCRFQSRHSNNTK